MTSLPSDLLTDPIYPLLKANVIQSTGLAYYADKDADLARRIRGRVAALELSDCASYLFVLQGPGGPAEMDKLVMELTIGETYFFRYSEQFDALREIVLPDLIKRKSASRHLRIWSAGCATGPEPYSVSILLKREFGHRIEGWDISILGTDINRQFLALAREGRFEEWALRSLPDDIRLRCFSQVGQMWVIAPEYREWVAFQYHNLVENPFPSLVNNLVGFDLILCRNVMIYFSPEIIRRMLAQFEQCLLEGGWFLVGHAEPNTQLYQSFHLVSAPGTALYQKRTPACPTPPAAGTGPYPWQLPALDSTADIPLFPLPQGTKQTLTTNLVPRASGEEKAPQAEETLSSQLAAVRQLADRGDWENALRVSTVLIDRDRLNPVAHFFHALILEGSGRGPASEQSLRQAIYLDRSFVLGHYHLGLLLQKKGDPNGARRSFRNVLTLLSPMKSSDTFDLADGITTGELTELTRMHLEVLSTAGEARG